MPTTTCGLPGLGAVSVYATGDTGENAVQLTTTSSHLGSTSVYNDSVFDRWLHVFDKASAATAGEQPIHRKFLPKKEESFIWLNRHYHFANGIYIAVSTDTDHTLATDNNTFFYVTFGD